MAREPSYPDDAPVGNPVGDTPAAAGEPAKPDDAEADEKPSPNRTRNIVTGAAIGIGSAALVAALLYANRSRKAGGEARAAQPERDRDD